MRTRPTWANVEWLEQNVLAGQGTVSECQRKTKAWTLAKSVESIGRVRKVFRADTGRFAIWVAGTLGTSDEGESYTGLGRALLFAEDLHLLYEVATVSVPLFTSDPATGDWDALVLFERREK